MARQDYAPFTAHEAPCVSKRAGRLEDISHARHQAHTTPEFSGTHVQNDWTSDCVQQPLAETESGPLEQLIQHAEACMLGQGGT